MKVKNKDSLLGIYMIAEYNLTEIAKQNDKVISYVIDNADIKNTNTFQYLFNISGTTEEFLKRISIHSNNSCPQTIISHLKHARDIGVAWAIFTM